jgi:hypothetical protein
MPAFDVPCLRFERNRVQPKWPAVEKLIKVFGVALVDVGKHFLDRPVLDLGFSALTGRLLGQAGVRTIGKLLQCSARSLESFGFTATQLQEVRERLAEHGLSLIGKWERVRRHFLFGDRHKRECPRNCRQFAC